MSNRQSPENDPDRNRRKPKRKRPNTKITGERSEAAFLHRANDLGFGVAKPWGDSLRYDFILDNGERLWRIQVKCTETIRARAYETRATYTVGKKRAVYTRKDIDFLVAHVVPLDLWYIVPVEVCTPAPMLRFYPHRKAKKMRLEKYKEAWRQLKPSNAPPDGPITIYACADEKWPLPSALVILNKPYLADRSTCGTDTPVRRLDFAFAFDFDFDFALAFDLAFDFVVKGRGFQPRRNPPTQPRLQPQPFLPGGAALERRNQRRQRCRFALTEACLGVDLRRSAAPLRSSIPGGSRLNRPLFA